jgi:nitrate reductase gamma subunit
MHTLYAFVLGPMVYAAVTVCILGTAWRITRVLSRPAFAPTLQIYPSKRPSWLYALGDALLLPTVARHNTPLWLALAVFHAGLVLLVLGHLELVRDWAIFQIVPHAVFLGKGLVGLAMLACLAFFLCRRLASPTKDISVPGDYLLLVLLALVVLFGSQLDWARTWFGYQTMDVADYRTYFAGLLAFKPDASGLEPAGHFFLLLIHVFLANLLLMVLPFTKLIHFVFSFALNALRRG